MKTKMTVDEYLKLEAAILVIYRSTDIISTFMNNKDLKIVKHLGSEDLRLMKSVTHNLSVLKNRINKHISSICAMDLPLYVADDLNQELENLDKLKGYAVNTLTKVFGDNKNE